MQLCKNARMQVYASMQICNYARMQVYASMNVCKYAIMQVCKYASMWVCKYTSMKFKATSGLQAYYLSHLMTSKSRPGKREKVQTQAIKHSVVDLRARHCLFLNGHIKSSEVKIDGIGYKVSLIKMRMIGKIGQNGGK